MTKILNTQYSYPIDNQRMKRTLMPFMVIVLTLVVISSTEDPIKTVDVAEPKPEAKSQQKIEPKIDEKAQNPGAEPLKITISQGAKKIETMPEPAIVQENPKFQGDGEEVIFKIDPLQENIIQTEERKQQKEEREKQEKKLHPWIAEQFEKFSEADQIQTHEIFSFEIAEEVDFKWNPTEFKSGPLKFVVEVFDFSRGDVTFPDNPEEDDYLEVQTQSESSNSYSNLGKVYLKKMFIINFFSDYQIIKFKNHYDKKMLIQVSLEVTKFVADKALDDDTLKIPAEKIKGILEELEQTEMKREKTYKSEWSFRDRQEHHQSQMLILTGVELVVILGTAIVQMYCIKNLFDNRLIV